MPDIAKPPPSLRRSGAAGLAATLVGVGLARFAYGPLLPAMVVAGWATPAGAAFIGAANLAGYLVGAVTARSLATYAAPPTLIRAMLVLASAAFFACAIDLGTLWLSLWRFAAGFAGALLVVLAPPLVLANAPAERRGLLGGVIFTGVGVGVVVSASLVPVLLAHSLTAAWLGLGIASACVAALGWSGWPHVGRLPMTAVSRKGETASLPPGLASVLVVYGLNAFGLVPHMVFLVDFVSRGLGGGIASGALRWAAFGLGALIGPLAAGRLADVVGFARAIQLALALELMGVALPLASSAMPALLVSSVIAGAFTPGIVPLVLGRVQDLVPDPRRTQAWGWATTSFALAQAAAAYGLSAIFAVTGSHLLLFAIGTAALALALVIALLSACREIRAIAHGQTVLLNRRSDR